MITRADIESASGELLGETDEYYLVRIFDDSIFYVHKDDASVTPCLIRDFYWESWITAWFINNIGPGSVFFDVGANAGYYSFIAARKGAKVVSFEPNPVYARMLQDSVEKIIPGWDITIYNLALSDHCGTALLNIPGSLHGSATLREVSEEYDTLSVPVDVRTLDSISLPYSNSILIKIDAEGAEEKIIKGMQGYLNALTVENVTIFLEYSPGMYSDEFIDVLDSYGGLSIINYDGLEERVEKDWVLAQKDWVTLVVRR